MDDLYASLYEHVACAVVRVRQGVVQFANPAAARLLLARPHAHLPHELLDDLFTAVARGLMTPPLRFELSLLVAGQPRADGFAPSRSARPFDAVLAPAPWYEGEWLLVLSPASAAGALDAAAEFLAAVTPELSSALENVRRLSGALAQAATGRLVQRLHGHVLEAADHLARMQDFDALLERSPADCNERLLLSRLLDDALAEARSSSQRHASNDARSRPPFDLATPSVPMPAVYGSRQWLVKCIASSLRHAAQHARAGGTIRVSVEAAGTSAFVKLAGIAPGPFDGRRQASSELSLARRIAQLHGGSILFEGGDGSTLR